jgi:CRISPR-associated endonuclease/helicase Cas3
VEAVAPPQHVFGCDGIAAPHHSRFAPDDRSQLDQAIEATFGKAADRTGGCIAVATQTVEQSLDIDADILLTDLCPMDVLLQRIGRLHRHTRERPDGFGTARCEVLVPEERDLGASITGEGKGIQGDHGLGTVYQDLRMLEATWQVLDDEALQSWRIPDHNRLLVERATHPNRLHRIVEEAEGDAWARHERWVMGEEMANAQHARYNTIDFATRYSENGFPSDTERIMTRLGEPDYRIHLPEPLLGPFGKSISEVSLPQWRFDEPPETDEASAATAFDGGFRFTIAGQTFRYDRFGIEDA